MHSGQLTLASSSPADAAALVNGAPGRDTAVREFLRPIDSFLEDAAVTEICINRPGEVFTEGPGGWQRRDVPAATLGWRQEARALDRDLLIAEGERAEPDALGLAA